MGSFKSISLFESGELHCWEQSPIDLLKHNEWLSNKIIKSIARYTNSLYLITKRYVNENAGLAFNKIYFSPTDVFFSM